MSAPATPKSDECDSCAWKTDDLEYVGSDWGSVTPGWLCDVCRNTMAGNAFLYPESYTDQSALFSTIAWGVNAAIESAAYGARCYEKRR